MKITDLIFDFLSEQVRDVGTYRFLLNKWFGENPTDEQKSDVEDLFGKYTQLKGQNRLRPDLPNVVTFLNRFRGFPIEDLTQPRKYSYEQMKFLIAEYFGGQEQGNVQSGLPEVLRGDNLRPNQERVDASKSLWFGDLYKIVDEGDFRVYKIPDRQAAKSFGYYQFTLPSHPVFKDNNYTGIGWCVGRWGQDNLYTSYRPGRSFYYVIDETKSPDKQTNPNIAQYYVSAVQYSTDSPTNYRITSILNDGSDPVITPDKLVAIYPKLGPHMDKIVFMDYNVDKELGTTTDPLDFVNENNPNSEYFFAAVPTELKRRYVVDRRKPISKAISWRSMNDDLKKAYFDLTESNVVFERFGNELFEEIKKNKQELRSLASRLEKINFKGGITALGFRLLKNEYVIHRYNQNNNKIIIFKTFRQPNRFGIFDASKLDWVEKGGKKYGPEYNQPKPTILVNKANKNEKFFVEIFNKSSEPSSDSFVSIYPIERGKSDKGYFMSYDSYLKMVDGYNLADQNTDIKPELEKQSDIKEKKGI